MLYILFDFYFTSYSERFVRFQTVAKRLAIRWILSNYTTPIGKRRHVLVYRKAVILILSLTALSWIPQVCRPDSKQRFAIIDM